MAIALELRGIRKRFTAGSGSCRASADVLRGVDLVLREGECAVIVGPSGSGKSTLMLCAAGLMTPDSGERRWFGDASRAAAANRSLYHVSVGDMMRDDSPCGPRVHLVDVPPGASAGPLELWIRWRCETGDAVLVSCCDEQAARRLGTRACLLRHGQLQGLAPPRARVAEFVDRSFPHV